MRKSTLFISAALTTFMLVVLLGVAAAYQKIGQAQSPDVAATTISGGTFTIEQAANLASNVLGRTDLYTAEITQFDGVDVYLVTFSSGDLVYVSKNGQILSISKLPATFILAPASGGNHNGGNNGDSSVTAPPTAPPDTGNDNNDGNDNGGGHEDGDD